MSWPIKRLGDMCHVTPGFAFKSADFSTEGIPVVKIANIRDDYTVDIADAQCWPSELFNDNLHKFILKDRDIVLAMTGATAGKVGRIRTSQDLLLNQRVARVRAFDADPDFIWFALSSPKYREMLFGIAGGAAQPNMSGGQIEAIEIQTPPRAVQVVIGHILSAYDDLIENNRRRMALLEESARLVYQEWFVRLRFPGHEHVRITNGLPRGWSKSDLESVCVPKIGIQTGPFGSQLHQSDYTEDGTPVVMPKDIIGSRVSTESIARVPVDICERLSRHLLEAGDIVLARRGDIGRKAFVTEREAGWMCGTGCMRLRPNATVVSPRYLMHTLSRPDVMGLIAGRAQGAIMPNLNLTILGDVPLILPPDNLQRVFDDLVRILERQITVLGEQANALARARDLLLPRLMSGEIPV